jgi:sugar/nucleoside kinase (ribokinase family)
MGDISAEITTALQHAQFVDVSVDTLVYSAVKVEAGGTAANFALAARRHFEGVSLLGLVGDDLFGRMLIDTLASAGVKLLEPPTRVAPTGLAIYVRDANPSSARGVRLLIVDTGANQLLDRPTIDRHRDAILNSDVFFLDGYTFLREPRREAALHAVDIARLGGKLTVLDLVPHDAHRHFSTQDVQGWIRRVDVLIVEVRTIRLLLGLSAPAEVSDPEIAHETWAAFERTFPGVEAHLRFGTGNINEALYCSPGEPVEHRHTGYVTDSDPRGFGDRLSAADVAALVMRRTSRTPPP